MPQQIELLRHGVPVGGRMYRGQVDHPLSEKGWEEMRNAVDGKKDWDAIYHSPLLRCSEFATELSGKLDIPLIMENRFREVGFGSWENRTGDDIRAENPDAIRNFYADAVNNRPEGAEVLRDFYLRVTQAWQEVVDQTQYQRPLVVAHAGVIRAVLAHVLSVPLFAMYRMDIKSAAMVSVSFPEERPPMIVFP